MNELALFAGAGGGILGGKFLGWTTVCAVEWNAYAAGVLCARQNDGILPPFPIWDDVQTFDGNPWRGIVDVVSGGFPCQDISSAGKGAGIDGERSGMWGHMARIIGEVRPRFAFVENSPMLTSRGLGRVLGDLAALGYDAKWGVLGAGDIGAPHQRDRIWIVATLDDTNGLRQLQSQGSEQYKRGWIGDGCGKISNANGSQCERVLLPVRSNEKNANACLASASGWWRQDPAENPESKVGRMADGVAFRMDRLKAIGNGQVPSVAALAFETLSK